VIVDLKIVNSEVFKSAFNNRFLEVPIKPEHLLVQLHEGRFKLFVDVASHMVWVLNLRERFARFGLFVAEVGGCRFRDSVHMDFLVAAISVLIELHVAYFFEGDHSGVVERHVAWQF
jgi:hypothetical protein